MKLNKWAALLLAAAVTMSLSACGDNTTVPDNAETTTTIAQTTTTAAETTTLSADVTTTAAETTTTVSTTKTTVATTTTTAKLDYLVKENFVYSYCEPVVKTDYETQEEYYEMRYAYVSVYPNGTTMFDFGEEKEVTYTQSVMTFSISEYALVPKTDIPECLAYVPEYVLSYMTQYTWEQLFDHADELPDEFRIVDVGGKPYFEFVPPAGGFYDPVYSYTVNNQTGDVTLKKENNAEGNELVGVKMKLGAGSMTIDYKIQSEECHAELTGKKIDW